MYPSSSNNNSNFNQAYFLNNEYPVNSEFSSVFDSLTMQNYDFEHVSRQFHHLLFHEDDCLGTNQSTTTATTTAVADAINDDYCNVDEDEDRKIPKRRSSKKDRHSKINTANGPRDRRVRLSRDVAPKFFGLQDMLGFDKPSKTVLWLLNNSSSAIRELIQGPCTTSVSSTTTECEEVVSGVDHDKSTNTCDYKSSLDKPSCTKEAMSSKGKKSKTPRPTVAKESRKKARERAKARASEKRSLLENEVRTTNHHTASYEMLEARDDHYNWNSTAVVSNYNQPNSGEEPQFTDSLFLGNRPWEAYSSFNLPG